jgi:hypothetical protein
VDSGKSQMAAKGINDWFDNMTKMMVISRKPTACQERNSKRTGKQ